MAGLVLNEPLCSFAQLATAAKTSWPHDAYFPGILQAADFPAALRAAGAPAIVVGARDATGALVRRGAGLLLAAGPRTLQLTTALTPATEPQVIRWLHARLPRLSPR